MPHALITGTTESGKSVLARSMARDAAKRGVIVVVYDPTMSAEWGTEFVTPDEFEFFSMLHAAIEHGDGAILACVDEADTLMSMSHRHNWWLVTRGRHYGIEALIITQRPKLVAPTIRGNVSAVYVFNLRADDANELAGDFNAPRLSEAVELSQGEFLRARWENKKKVVDKFKVF